MTRRLLAPLTCVVALALGAGCTAAPDDDGSGTTSGAWRADGSDRTESDAAGAGDDAVVGDPVTLTLGVEESVFAVSPSGDYLVTVTEPTFDEGDDDWVVDVCVRTGEDYQTAECADGGSLARYPVGADWNEDETLLAYLCASSHKVNAVCVVDVSTGQVRALTDVDGRVERTTVLTWLDDGRIAYSWAQEDGTQIRTVDPAIPEAEPEVLQALGDVEIEQLFAIGDRLLFEGSVGIAKGVYDLDGGSSDPQLLVPLSVFTAVIAADTVGERLALQAWDVHVAMPLTVIDVPTGTEHEIGEVDLERYVAAAAFSGDDQHLLTLSYVDVRGELQILDRDLRVVGTHLFDRTARSHFYRGVDWTDRGIVLVTSTDGQPQTVSVFPVDLPPV